MRLVQLAIVLAATLPVAAIAAIAAQRPILEPIEDEEYTFKEPLDPGKHKKGEPEEAFDISGIACLPIEKGKARHCLVVNDEGPLAEHVKIKDRTFKPIETVKLTANNPLGPIPANKHCRTPDEPAKPSKEFDGEGVAYANRAYYVVGSHGCGRKKGQFKLSTLRLARIPLDADGDPDEDGIATTYRLAKALAEAETVGAYFLKPLTEQNGLNVEGIAVRGDRLYAGLRAPSLASTDPDAGKAFLVRVSLKALFEDDAGSSTEPPKTIPLKVAKDAGIRDLATLDDDPRLLVLTGPAQEQPDVPYSLYAADPETGETTLLGDLAALKGKDRCGKAEAVVHLGGSCVLIMFDSLENGGPKEYEIDLGR